jgi:hypothetical protein
LANRLAVPQPTEWQGIGDQIDAAFVFAWADFVNVHRVKKQLLFRAAIFCKAKGKYG